MLPFHALLGPLLVSDIKPLGRPARSCNHSHGIPRTRFAAGGGGGGGGKTTHNDAHRRGRALDANVVALDAKMVVDDNDSLADELALSRWDREDPSRYALVRPVFVLKLDGNVGCSQWGGLAMATMDLVNYYGGDPAQLGHRRFVEIRESRRLLQISQRSHRALDLFTIFAGSHAPPTSHGIGLLPPPPPCVSRS